MLSTSGKGTSTNKDGYYEIEVMEKDSIWFSYLNKPTVKFPVLKIANPMGFDISILVNVPELKEVKVHQRSYRLDSIQNRMDYAKIFNYKKPGIKPQLTPGGFGAGVGFDLDELINVFRRKKRINLLPTASIKPWFFVLQDLPEMKETVLCCVAALRMNFVNRQMIMISRHG